MIFKKGDKQIPENYRPICITPIMYRLFSKILMKRVSAKLDEAQSNDQAGFRPGFSTTDHLFALTILCGKVNEHRLPLWIATRDFQKAFDSVSHEAIWSALKEQGIELVYIEMLQRLYDGQEAKVKTDAPSSFSRSSEAQSKVTQSARLFPTQ